MKIRSLKEAKNRESEAERRFTVGRGSVRADCPQAGSLSFSSSVIVIDGGMAPIEHLPPWQKTDNDNDDDNDYYIRVAPASARGLRSPFVRQTWAVMG
jgi:hypothetical protein